MADVTQITLGVGDLFINGINVGYLKGNVEFTYGRTTIDFKPANALGVVKQFVQSENVTLSASVAELNVANLRLAMGISEAISPSQSIPAFENSPSGGSYVPSSGASFDVLSFGGSKVVSELPLRFVHTRPNGKDIVIALYKCVATPEITIPFAEEDVILMPISFQALHITSRSVGDQIGWIADQVQGS